MPKLRLLVLVAIAIIAIARPAFPANSIVVESRNFSVGQPACSLGIWLTNDVPVVGLVLILEARAVNGGAFYAPGSDPRPRLQPGRRLDLSPLGTTNNGGQWPPASTTRNRYPTPGGVPCTGPVAHTYEHAAAAVDAIPPDGFTFVSISSGDENAGDDIDLDVGSDPVERDSASWVIVFNANNLIGCFEIDTCCERPAGHTNMIDRNTNEAVPVFQKSTVCLGSPTNQPPIINCPSSVTQAKDPGQGGAIVSYTVTYFDEDTTLIPACNPPSGSFFTIGTTFVTCIVADTFGMADTCEFPVIVVDADGNRVIVQSDTFFINQPACTVGVYLSNVLPIVGLVLPLDIRSISGGAFYQTPSGGSAFFSRRIGGRLDLSPLGSADPGGNWPAASTTQRKFDSPGSPTCGPRTYQTSVSQVGGTSPDAVLYACVSAGDALLGEEIALQPGADPLTPGSASWQFIFNANGNSGCFEIDTCCTTPASHLSFLDEQTTLQPAGFTKGTICLALNSSTNYPPSVTCPPIVWHSVDNVGNGANVTFTVDVADEDPNLEAVCTPSSGSFFPLGTTLVTCIATDTAGLADTCSFDVVVHNAVDNSVVVESKTFQPGQAACSVGVFISNTEPVAGMVLIFELRTINGAFYKGPVGSSFFRVQPGQRLDDSPLGSANPLGPWPAASVTMRRFDTTNTFNQCGGPISHSWGSSVSFVGGTSPDAVEHATVSQGNESIGEQVSLVPGADPMFTGSASLVFVFDADTIEGCFEVDTACTTPANHLNFVDEQTNLIDVSFTKGTICISNCICDCHGNPAGCADPTVNILDVLYTISVAFRGASPINDVNLACPLRTTDVNCDGVTSVVDAIKMVEVAFRNGNPATVFCDPCP